MLQVHNNYWCRALRIMYKPWRLWFLQLLLIIFVHSSEAGTYYRYMDNYLSHCSDQDTVYSSDTYYLDPTYFSYSYYSYAPSSCYMRFYSSSSSYGLSAYVYSVSMYSCTPYVTIRDGYSSSSSVLRRVSCTSTSSGTYYSTGRYLYVYYYRGSTTGQDFRIRIQRGSSLSTGSLSTYYLDNYLSHCSSQVTVGSSSTYYLDPTSSSYSYVSAPSSCYMRFYSSSSSYGLSAYVYSVSMSSCTPYVNIYDGYSSSSSLLRTVRCTSTSSGTYYSTGRYLYVYYYRGSTTGHDFRIRIQRGSYLSSGYTCYSCTSCSGTGGSTTSCSYGCYKTVTTYSGYRVISKGCLSSSSVSNGCTKQNFLVEYEYCYCRSSYCNAAQVTRSGVFRPLGIAGLIISLFQYMYV